MDQPNDLPSPGSLRDKKTCLGNYRGRAYWIGVIQLTLSIIYLLAVFVHTEQLSAASSAVNRKFTYLVKSENQTVGTLEVNVHNPALDAAFSKLFFWMTLNTIRAFLHMLSSSLIIWATRENAGKLLGIWFCNSARLMNLAFLLYEIVVFVFMYQDWEFAICFVLFRFWFEFEVRGLLNTELKLAPPPPGHSC